MRKKNFAFLAITCYGLTMHAQVGIRTQNPQSTFHVDGSGNNPATGAPSAANATDDFVVTSNGNTGIGIITPAQKLDINGNARIRGLPVGTPPGTVVAQQAGANGGVLGYSPGFPVMDVSSTGAAADTNSGAMFVVKRFSVGDWPSGQNGGAGFDTTMESTKWEAFVSNIAYTFGAGSATTIFGTAASGYRLKNDGSRWRISGDIPGINEVSVIVDVLFIKKGVVAADSRTN
ncbi:hypothetical protein IQ37_06550 [Chryseobacterium piperi]|uniref:T9SS C-terminal target domain-containing protein n=1 Tax=Chryseobacterium piperi TaxID=558152 RepID=A0A086BJV1_9FLAO|nr:hypothetical protein [Chryseobacterium piperi]ASW73770.1 hypothetical protein CJF12_05350 [Chryseobacterium piperi]KFF29215.1 hypothetical protein IQ37_06550 [Chryseobacterium piperi]